MEVPAAGRVCVRKSWGVRVAGDQGRGRGGGTMVVAWGLMWCWHGGEWGTQGGMAKGFNLDKREGT